MMRIEDIIPEWGEREFNYKGNLLGFNGVASICFGLLSGGMGSAYLVHVITGNPVEGRSKAFDIVGSLVFVVVGASLLIDSRRNFRQVRNAKIVLYPDGFRWYSNSGTVSPLLPFSAVIGFDEGSYSGWGTKYSRTAETQIATTAGRFTFNAYIDNYDELRDLFRKLARVNRNH